MATKERDIYFDANATTFMPDVVKQAIINYMDQGNPSAAYPLAVRSRALIDAAKEKLLELCSVTNKTHIVLFTSGASEGNNFIIRSVVDSFWAICQKMPHIIMNNIEHKTSLLCVENLVNQKRLELTLIKAGIDGVVNPANIEKAIGRNNRTCLISVMSANNEIGSMNDLVKIVEIAHSRDVAVHSDVTQSFGKYAFNLREIPVDVITLSFHKCFGPVGIGAVIISKKLIKGYKLCPLICGTQNDGLRGGTQPLMLIAGAYAALEYNFVRRNQKNEELVKLKASLILGLGEIGNLTAYEKDIALKKGYNFIIIGNPEQTLPNTVLFSIVFKREEGVLLHICNITLRKKLQGAGIVVGTGSACNKGAASHVLIALGIPEVITRSVLRISFCDNNTLQEVDRFLQKFKIVLTKIEPGVSDPDVIEDEKEQELKKKQ